MVVGRPRAKPSSTAQPVSVQLQGQRLAIYWNNTIDEAHFEVEKIVFPHQPLSSERAALLL